MSRVMMMTSIVKRPFVDNLTIGLDAWRLTWGKTPLGRRSWSRPLSECRRTLGSTGFSPEWWYKGVRDGRLFINYIIESYLLDTIKPPPPPLFWWRNSWTAYCKNDWHCNVVLMIMTQNGKPNKSPVLASSLSDGPNLGRRKFSGPASTQHPLKVYFPIMLFISHHQHLHKGRMTRLWIFSISVTWKEPPVPRFCLIFFHVLCWDTRLTDKVCNVVTHVHDLLL